MKIKDFTSRICILFKDNIYKIFSIGYYEDGGYFITDLSEINGYKYVASKIRYKPQKRRTIQEIPIDIENTYQTSLKHIKISHHGDGNAQISGKGVISGFDSNGEPKGLYVKSFSKDEKNDGGPIFLFNIGLNTLKNFPIISLISEVDKGLKELNKKQHLILHENIIVDMTRGRSKYNFIIEGYYIHKSEIPENYKFGEPIYKIHLTYGPVSLAPLLSPEQCPYCIGILFIKDHIGVKKNFFSYGGAPGRIVDGEWDNLHILLFKDGGKEYKNLNYD